LLTGEIAGSFFSDIELATHLIAAEKFGELAVATRFKKYGDSLPIELNVLAVFEAGVAII